MAGVLLHEVLAGAAERAPDEVALITDAGTQTFAELAEPGRRGRAGVAAITEPGDRVAILAENRAEYVECYYAVPRAGRLLVPAQPAAAPDEWRRDSFERSGARVLIARSGPARAARCRRGPRRRRRDDRQSRRRRAATRATPTSARTIGRGPVDRERRRRRVAHRHERHHGDAEARDADPRVAARRGRRDPDRATGAATTTCSARRSRSATSRATTSSGSTAWPARSC